MLRALVVALVMSLLTIRCAGMELARTPLEESVEPTATHAPATLRAQARETVEASGCFRGYEARLALATSYPQQEPAGQGSLVAFTFGCESIELWLAAEELTGALSTLVGNREPVDVLLDACAEEQRYRMSSDVCEEALALYPAGKYDRPLAEILALTTSPNELELREERRRVRSYFDHLEKRMTYREVVEFFGQPLEPRHVGQHHGAYRWRGSNADWRIDAVFFDGGLVAWSQAGLD